MLVKACSLTLLTAGFGGMGDLVVVTAPLWPTLSSNTVVAGYSGVRGVLTSWCVWWWWWCLSCCCVVAGGSGWEASEASDGAVMASITPEFPGAGAGTYQTADIHYGFGSEILASIWLVGNRLCMNER